MIGKASASPTPGRPSRGQSPGCSRWGLARRVGLALLMQVCAMGQSPLPPLDLTAQQWNGDAICYSGYRLGQHPDRQAFPSEAQVLEDLRILDRHWRLIRMYGSDQHSRDVLVTIRKHRLKLRVMLGIWLSGKPEKLAENSRQVASGIRLAREFPDIVAAVSVGNEALVAWSDHRMSEDALMDHLRQVKASVTCPVTVADDFLYWVQPGNKLTQHIDFITLHSYPIWGHQDIDEGLSSTIDKFDQVRRAYPGKTIVFGEVGWASYTEPHAQHVPRAGDEAKQKRYFQEIHAWARSRGVTTFFFEAFDEPWKGEGTEGHWGVFSVDRKAKPAVLDLFPDLKANHPTSPSYEAPSGGTRKPAGK